MSDGTDLSPDETRSVLLWVLERLLIDPQADRCNRCGHSGHYHRKDDADPTPVEDSEFRCIFPLPNGPFERLCTCPDYVRFEAVVEGEGHV